MLTEQHKQRIAAIAAEAGARAFFNKSYLHGHPTLMFVPLHSETIYGFGWVELTAAPEPASDKAGPKFVRMFKSRITEQEYGLCEDGSVRQFIPSRREWVYWGPFMSLAVEKLNEIPVPTEYAEPLPEGDKQTQFYWLIELPHKPPSYFSATEQGHWTHDANKALKFETKEEGQGFLNGRSVVDYPGIDLAKVIQHGFLPAEPLPETKPAEQSAVEHIHALIDDALLARINKNPRGVGAEARRELYRLESKLHEAEQKLSNMDKKGCDCEICHAPIYATQEWRAGSGEPTVHEVCYWQQRAEAAEQKLAARNKVMAGWINAEEE